jgi:hypothetical protein
MKDMNAVLDRIYAGDATLGREEIYRRAVAMDASLESCTDLYVLADGEYTRDQAAAAMARARSRSLLAVPAILVAPCAALLMRLVTAAVGERA